MTSVRETFGLACPRCGCDDDIAISVTVWVDVFPDGTLERLGTTHEWDRTSPCRCMQCTHSGIVADISIGNGGAS